MRVAVLGSSGGMGSLFVRYFVSGGHEVVCSDTRPRRFAGTRLASSNAEAASDADCVLTATPIDSTVRTAREVLPHMKKGAVLVEISSVKEKILPELIRLTTKNGTNLLSIHPLFGPSLKDSGRMKFAVIKDVWQGSTRFARKLFPKARLIPIDAEMHDRAMAVILSLTHACSLTFASAAAGGINPEEMAVLSTPSSSLQLALARSVITQDPELYSFILFENRYSREVLRSLRREVSRILRLLEAGDRQGYELLFRQLRNIYGNSGADVRRVYRAAGF